MAAVCRRRGQPNWYARFMINRKDCCITSGTLNKKAAIAFVKKKLAILKGDYSLDCHFDGMQPRFAF